MSALVVEDVRMRFGGLIALQDIQMDVLQGERRAIIGPNGAGKSTLFNIIAGDVLPSEGRVLLNGIDVTQFPPYKRVSRGLRRTYQTSALFDTLTVSENLYLGALGPDGAAHFNMSRLAAAPAVVRRAELAAEAVRLTGRRRARAGDLSHGERRQLEIGLAIANEPRLILLDEPAAGLSADERYLITELLLGLDRAMTVMLIEHDMEIALTVGERVTVLHEGAVIAEGTPASISANPLVQQVYLGRR